MPSYKASHLVIVLVCFGILLLAFLVSPVDSGSSHLKLGRFPIPSTCSFNDLTGYPCPGCGLSRSMVAAVHGDFRGSFRFHRLGLVTVFYLSLQLIFQLGMVVSSNPKPGFVRISKILNRGVIFLAVVFGLNWILTLIALFF